MVAFGYSTQNFGRWEGFVNVILLFSDFMFNGGDTAGEDAQTLPAVIKRI